MATCSRLGLWALGLLVFVGVFGCRPPAEEFDPFGGGTYGDPVQAPSAPGSAPSPRNRNGATNGFGDSGMPSTPRSDNVPRYFGGPSGSDPRAGSGQPGGPGTTGPGMTGPGMGGPGGVGPGGAGPGMGGPGGAGMPDGERGARNPGAFAERGVQFIAEGLQRYLQSKGNTFPAFPESVSQYLAENPDVLGVAGGEGRGNRGMGGMGAQLRMNPRVAGWPLSGHPEASRTLLVYPAQAFPAQEDRPAGRWVVMADFSVRFVPEDEMGSLLSTVGPAP